MRFETSRLLIRPYEARDAQLWIAMVNDPEVRRFLPATPDATATTFEEALAYYAFPEEHCGASGQITRSVVDQD